MSERFVILRHDPPADGSQALHWDLMLEAGDVLRTWSLEEEPQMAVTIAATALADHRKAYLEYEGPVSRNRGYVTQWDSGLYESLSVTDDELLVRLRGAILRGNARLKRSEEDPQRWTVQFSTG